MRSKSRYFLVWLLLSALLVPETSRAPPGRGRTKPELRSTEQATKRREEQARELREEIARELREKFGSEPYYSPHEKLSFQDLMTRSTGPEPKLLVPGTQGHSTTPRELRLSAHYRPLQQTRTEYRRVQESLNLAIGSKLKVDGKFGPNTQEAIRDFQRRSGLGVDGILGPETQRRLMLEAGVGRDRFRSWPGRSVQAIYIDVVGEGDEIRVNAEPLPFGSHYITPRPEYSLRNVQRISSPNDLKDFSDRGLTVIHAGQDLPGEWLTGLKGTRYVRVSKRSPKQTFGEHAKAAEQLVRPAELGKTRIFSALPQAQGISALRAEIKAMTLRIEETKRWQKLGEQVRGVEQTSRFSIERASKDGVLSELRSGSNLTLVLVAHFANKTLYLPGGATITVEEFSDIHRETAPERTIILVSCQAGTVNAPVESLAEILLKNKLATTVIASAKPVSALSVPALLQNLLVEGQTIGQVFAPQDFQAITQRIGEGRAIRLVLQTRRTRIRV